MPEHESSRWEPPEPDELEKQERERLLEMETAERRRVIALQEEAVEAGGILVMRAEGSGAYMGILTLTPSDGETVMLDVRYPSLKDADVSLLVKPFELGALVAREARRLCEEGDRG